MKILWIVRQDLSCYVKIFCFTLVQQLNILRAFSRLISLFSHSAKSVFRQQLSRKAIQNEQSQYQITKSEIETG